VGITASSAGTPLALTPNERVLKEKAQSDVYPHQHLLVRSSPGQPSCFLSPSFSTSPGQKVDVNNLIFSCSFHSSGDAKGAKVHPSPFSELQIAPGNKGGKGADFSFYRIE